MRDMFLIVAIIVGAAFAYSQYNLPECGTAPVCGHAVHDILHAVL